MRSQRAKIENANQMPCNVRLLAWIVVHLFAAGVLAGLPSTLDAQEQQGKPTLHHCGTDPLSEPLRREGFEITHEGLSEALQSHKRELIRGLAAILIQRHGFVESMPVLVESAKSDPSDTVRRTATSSICNLEGSECLPCARAGLDRAPDHSSKVGWAATLARYGEPEIGVRVFLETLESPEHRLDAMAKASLFLGVDYPSFDPLHLLIQWLASDSPDERAVAVDEVASGLQRDKIPFSRVEELLKTLSEDEDPEFRRKVLRALDFGYGQAQEIPDERVEGHNRE